VSFLLCPPRQRVKPKVLSFLERAIYPLWETVNYPTLKSGVFGAEMMMKVHRDSISQVLDQLEDFRPRVWTSPCGRFYPYKAPIMNLSRSGNIPVSKCFSADYFEAFAQLMSRLKEDGLKYQGSGLYGYPMPPNFNCGAAPLHSIQTYAIG
jgi:hypothetical protein